MAWLKKALKTGNTSGAIKSAINKAAGGIGNLTSADLQKFQRKARAGSIVAAAGSTAGTVIGRAAKKQAGKMVSAAKPNIKKLAVGALKRKSLMGR